MKRVILGYSFLLLSTFHILFSPLCTPRSLAMPAEDVQLITDTQYVRTAQKMIGESKKSIYVIMFEMAFYDKYPNTPSNSLIRELIEAKKRGVKVEVILEVREGEDRTTKRNRRTGKILSQAGIEIIYDSFSKTTHAKVMVVDGQFTLVGSTNWTYEALTNNHEVSVLIRSKEAAKETIDYFNKVKSTGSLNPAIIDSDC